MIVTVASDQAPHWGKKERKIGLAEKKCKMGERSEPRGVWGYLTPFLAFFPGVWGLFLESPANFSGPESCFVFSCVCVQDQSFNNFENNTIELLVNEAKLTGLWAKNCATM